jgi:signal transduction histidine kinase
MPGIPDVRIALYRIAQEAMNNIAKHAHASQVQLECDLLGTAWVNYAFKMMALASAWRISRPITSDWV